MANEHLRFTSESRDLEADALVLESVEGEAALSAPYRFLLRLRATQDGGLAPEVMDDLLRKSCTVVFGDGPTQVVHGRLRWVELETVEDPARITYLAELAPEATKLERIRRSRVFQEVDLPALIRRVMSEVGLREGRDFELRVVERYPTSEYVVQWEETDWDFLCRWLEHFGVHFAFEQRADHACMVIGDSNRAFALFGDGPVPFGLAVGDPGREGVRTLSRRVTPTSASIVLREHNWRTPAIALQNQAPADQKTGFGFSYFYGDHYKTPNEGNVLARLRSEELLARRELYRAASMLPGLWPGHVFELAGHPLGELDGHYVVTRTTLRAQLGAAATSPPIDQELELIRAEVPYRPARTTPRPRIDGLVQGYVDGPVRGTAAPIDEHGRYKVLFPFDLVGQGGGAASRWIRVAQPSSGPSHGVHLPLHVAAEVLVAHVAGDPDRPVIVGSPHNTSTVNPVTSRNPTQSVIKTQAGVRIVIDDDVL